jgi:hypothetical protein
MAHQSKIRDYTGSIPFIIFVIFAGIVVYSWYKGTHPEKVKTEDKNVAGS